DAASLFSRVSAEGQAFSLIAVVGSGAKNILGIFFRLLGCLFFLGGHGGFLFRFLGRASFFGHVVCSGDRLISGQCVMHILAAVGVLKGNTFRHPANGY
uniref:hypothetical protein n=1 Tax=Marinobacterium profundum TaxID=1714300 RepID=UPI001C1F9C61